MEDVQRDIEQITHRTRITYSTALAVALLVNLSGWFVAGAPDALSAAERGAITVALLGAFVGVRRFPDRADRIMQGGLVVAGLAVLVSWSHHLFEGVTPGLLAPTALGLAVVIVGAFALVPARMALLATGALVAIVALFASVAVWVHGAQPADATQVLRLIGALALVLVLSTTATIGRERLNTALARAQLLEELATTDPLTGLANRRGAIEVLGRETQRTIRYGSPLSVMLIDLDEFKTVNDRHGHAAGDDVLRGVASILQATLRESDFVARWGGEEFLVVTPHSSADQASMLGERVRRQISHGRPGGHHVTASFGITEFDGEESIDRLLTRVDHLMYEAKGQGRNRVVDRV